MQIKPEPIGSTLDAIRSVLDGWMGEPRRLLTERSAKLIYRYTAIDGTPAKLKIEINTTEHFHIQPLQVKLYSINSEWFQGLSHVITYQLNELMGTKLRALYQRRKGRDLFDLWYTLDRGMVNTENVITIFNHYCERHNDTITRALFEQSLSFKKQHRDFQSDILPLLTSDVTWHFEKAISLVEQHYITKLPGDPWKKSNL